MIAISSLVVLSFIPVTLSAGTVRPANLFNDDIAKSLAEELRGAVKGAGTKESRIKDILAGHTVAQRLKIREAYRTLYNDDLIERLKRDMSGECEDLMVNIFRTNVELYTHHIHGALRGSGTDSSTLIEIAVALSRSNEIKNQVVQKYTELFQKDLILDVGGPNPDGYKGTIKQILTTNRAPEPAVVDKALVKKDAESLHNVLQKILDNEDKLNSFTELNRILIETPYNHLHEVAALYAELYDEDLCEVMDDIMENELGETYRQLGLWALDEYEHYAVLFRKAMKGAGTRNNTLIRLVLSRCEIDLDLIEQAYYDVFGNTLQARIADDTKGDYKDLILDLTGPESDYPQSERRSKKRKKRKMKPKKG